MEIVSAYEPHERQREAHRAKERFIGYGGAMGGGKTRWGCEEGLALSLEFPHNFGVICRQSGPALRMSTMESFFSQTLVPGSKMWQAVGAEFNKGEGLLTLGVNGSKIWFTGLDADNTERIKSLELGWFFIDEATEVSEAIFQMFITRLRRSGVSSRMRKGLISANPEAGWVKRRFVDQHLPDHRFVVALPADNPYLPEDYASLFETLPDRWRRKYLLGSWDAASGLIYPSFDEKVHVVPWVEIPPHWKVVRGLDHGQRNPTACLGAVVIPDDKAELERVITPAGMEKRAAWLKNYPTIVCFRLYYAPGVVSEHKRWIKRMFEDIAKPGLVFADPSIWGRDREKLIEVAGKETRREYSIADEYMEEPDGLRGLVRGTNLVLPGLDRVETLLKGGHLFFMDHPSLQPLIGPAGEIRNYEWKEAKESLSMPEVPQDRDDHACDALRYLVMSLPQPAVQAKVVPAGTFDRKRKEAQQWRQAQKGRGMVIDISRAGRLRLAR